MEFRDHQAIYLQIVDYACEQVLLKTWLAEDKIPSIRDLATELQVNPNTIQRSYDFLQELGVIANRRGVGIFVEKDAIRKVMAYKKAEFTRKELPVVFKNMFLLKMDMSELETLFNNYQKSHSKK
jgi:DNA-binding transcriptional regulator YhcF (GntR family)